MHKHIIEFIGTFFLVLTVAFTGNPIAIGAVLTALVYMGGYISGAQYNPAVSIALLLSGKQPLKVTVQFMVVQLLAGVVAAAMYQLITNTKFIPEVATGTDLGAALLIEVLFTFLLCSVVLHVAATSDVKGNQYFGLAIGLALMTGAFVAGPISGGALNPAVGVSPLLFDFGSINTHVTHLSIYLIGPVIGGVLAGFVYRMIHTD